MRTGNGGGAGGGGGGGGGAHVAEEVVALHGEENLAGARGRVLARRERLELPEDRRRLVLVRHLPVSMMKTIVDILSVRMSHGRMS